MPNHDQSAATLTSLPELEAKRRFRAMNTDVEVTLADWRQARRLPPVEALFHDFEARFSRFLPDSELSRFNAREQARTRVSLQMADLLGFCRDFYEVTGGVFSPLVLAALESAGYDRSFERVGGVSSLAATSVASFGAMRLIEPDQAELPLGLRLDFGGIGKGYCVDLAADLLDDCGGFLVSAGGDLFAAGFGPDGGAWRIDVSDPLAPPAVLLTLALCDRAVASSWTTRRRWQAGSGWANHLIDPRTGLPVDNGVAGVTVVASTTTEADVFAKTALIQGPVEGSVFLETQQAAGLFVLWDGSHVVTPGWSQYMAP